MTSETLKPKDRDKAQDHELSFRRAIKDELKTRKLSLRKICKEYGLSEPTLYRLFNEDKPFSPRNYVMDRLISAVGGKKFIDDYNKNIKRHLDFKSSGACNVNGCDSAQVCNLYISQHLEKDYGPFRLEPEANHDVKITLCGRHFDLYFNDINASYNALIDRLSNRGTTTLAEQLDVDRTTVNRLNIKQPPDKKKEPAIRILRAELVRNIYDLIFNHVLDPFNDFLAYMRGDADDFDIMFKYFPPSETEYPEYLGEEPGEELKEREGLLLQAIQSAGYYPPEDADEALATMFEFGSSRLIGASAQRDEKGIKTIVFTSVYEVFCTSFDPEDENSETLEFTLDYEIKAQINLSVPNQVTYAATPIK